MKKRYMKKQKLMGLGILLFAAVTVLLLGDFSAAFFIAPIGLVMIFEKRVVLSEYYIEKEKRSKRIN